MNDSWRVVDLVASSLSRISTCVGCKEMITKYSQMSVGYSIYYINFWNFWCNFGAKNPKGQLATNLLYKVIVDMTFENFYLVHSPDDRHCLSLYVCVCEREIEI